MIPSLTPTEVFDSYWQFAAERLAIYYRRRTDPVGPWTDDPILREYRFTNTFRAADRVSQYLIREIQYHKDRPQAPTEIFFRTILFKIFNKIDTWESLERELGPLNWQSSNLEAISDIMDRLMRRGQRIYSAAYIMPSPAFGQARKHSNHLAMLAKMMRDGLPGRIASARNFHSAYEMMLDYPGLGPFLAFQYTIDLNYSTLLDFEEADFVVAGPGAIDGIAKCFTNAGSIDPARVIHAMTERQDEEFRRLGLTFDGLFGRALQPIDCQNLFCEISKYARVAHPNVGGSSGRTRIKQRYRPHAEASVSPYFPPKWSLNVPPASVDPTTRSNQSQLSLF